MKRFTRIITVSAVILGITFVGSNVAARNVSSDQAALTPARISADQGVEKKVDALLARMTVDEKLQQVQLLSDGQITDDDAEQGVGGVFSLTDPAKINHFQRVAVKKSRLHIPILFAYDTIHGYRTIFPVPLGAASSFDPQVATKDASIGARESATVGIKQIYSPMVDVSHEPRWGRIVEGNGEDPYLGSVMAAARVKGAQGSDYAARNKTVTSVKHFVAYGQPEGGRDYNTTDMSESRLRNLYLPPFKAAVDAGSDTVMCSFNSLNGVPGCANKDTETGILKNEWGFDGFIESDYTALAETRACPPKDPDEGSCGHGTAADGPEAGANSLMAGTDSEMVSTNIRDNGKALLKQGKISMARLDDAVRRILRVKFRAGLFEHPYVNQAKATDPASFITTADRAAARKAASRSMVLLKNTSSTLPLAASKKTAVIGPFGDDQHDMLGPWWGKGEDKDAVSVLAGIRAQSPGATYTAGLHAEERRAPGRHRRRRVQQRRCRRRHGRRQGCGPGGAHTRRDPRDERRGRVALEHRPSRRAAAADRRREGDRQAVRRGPLQRPPAHPVEGGGRVPRDPRGVVPRDRGRQRGRRRGLRQDQPRWQAAGVVPADARAGADLLQPRADRTPLRRHAEVQLPLPRPAHVRPALRVRPRPELHDVLDQQPAAR